MIRATPGDLYLDDMCRRVIAARDWASASLVLLVASDVAEVLDA